MSDTDLPSMEGLEPAPRRPRPIASPFGALPMPSLSGFNVQASSALGFNIEAMPTPMGWLPPQILSNFATRLTPSRQDVAQTLGTPLDALGYLAHRMGLPMPGSEALPGEYPPSPGTSIQPWIPSAGVPLSSRNIRGMLDNSSSLDSLLYAIDATAFSESSRDDPCNDRYRTPRPRLVPCFNRFRPAADHERSSPLSRQPPSFVS
jgi:hypothetical protein